MVHSGNASALDTVELPFLWIADEHAGPRPTYPWFAAGRLTLQFEHPAAGRVGNHADAAISTAMQALDGLARLAGDARRYSR